MLIRIYKILIFVLCIVSSMLILLGLYQTQASYGQLDKLLVGFSRRRTFITGNGINEHKRNVTDNDKNNTQRNNQTTRKTSSIFLDYQQVLKSGNFSMNQSVNISEVRPDTCDACFPQSSYIYKNDNLCSTNNSTTQVKLLIIILTAVSETHNRTTVRKTWTSISNKNTGELRYVFVLGKHAKDPTWNMRALEEAKIYGDIIIKDFMDVYNNLTLKTMSGLKWASDFCSNAKYVMKTDTDTYVNTPKLLQLIDSFEIENEIIGKCAQHIIPRRNETLKYYVSPVQYPHLTYPPYCLGGAGYVTTMEVVKGIARVSPNIPFFFFEDVYVGLCNEALGYKVRSVKEFNKKLKRNACWNQKIIITSHRVSPREIRKTWNTKCLNKNV
ncbi:unnamed protein product [Owenia fusiformis]|uniref:Hexosyltransferase n=1 Tax=Owenia fusiformis TaxID=6347 RepID=A0A8J1UHJ4_OWEFU|nr:unnamed protein product [Owenia fusiformis]